VGTINHALLALLGIAGVVITILHFLGVLDIPWVNQRIPIFTLLIMALIAEYLALGMTGELDKMAGQIVSTLGGTEVKYFENISEVYAYVRERMKAAHGVDDLTWGPCIYRVSPAHERAYAEYREAICELASRSDFQYREVMTFPDAERLDLAQRMLEKGLPAYRLKYYEIGAMGAPPFVRFVLVGDEVIFVQHRKPGLPEEGVVWLAVRQPGIVEMARVYYAEVWKDARPVDIDTLRRIRASLPSPVPTRMAGEKTAE
jgi:hypothetical protein